MRDFNDISKYSDNDLTVIGYLINGRNEINTEKAKLFFERGLINSKANFKVSRISHSLYIECLIELASIENNIKRRTSIWNDIVNKLFDLLNQYSDNVDTVEYCTDAAIEYIKEPFIAKDFNLRKKILSVVKDKLGKLIANKDNENSLSLLIKKAAILRKFSSYQPTPEARKLMLEEAIRCVEKSMRASDKSWYGYHELGNCQLKSSEFEKKLDLYNTKIMQAEESFLKSQQIKITTENALALCNLYTSTYQISPFLSAFKVYESIEDNRRRFLQNSYLLAENTIKMYYAEYPATLLSEYISKSDLLLNESIWSGYEEARTITNLAFIKAITGQISVGENILKTLKISSTETFDWNIIIEDIQTIKESEDLFSKGFVLGIDDANTWNKLGTFAIKFLDDVPLGIKMYETALKFNPKSPKVLTNIARAILKTKYSHHSLLQAETFISNAASASNFRFQWWREVRSNVESALGAYNKDSTDNTDKIKFRLTKISELYKFYLHLKTVDSPQERGYDFEKLIAAYFELTLGNSISSHRIKNIPTEQIDGAFFLDKEYYRVEAKWTSKKVDHTDIGDFYFKIRTKGVTGLFISINGFTESAVDRARLLKNEVKLILMDGNEIEATLKGSPTFDEAIRIKQLYFYLEDNPYHKISAEDQSI